MHNTYLMHIHPHLQRQALQALQCQNQEQFFLLMNLRQLVKLCKLFVVQLKLIKQNKKCRPLRIIDLTFETKKTIFR